MGKLSLSSVLSRYKSEIDQNVYLNDQGDKRLGPKLKSKMANVWQQLKNFCEGYQLVTDLEIARQLHIACLDRENDLWTEEAQGEAMGTLFLWMDRFSESFSSKKAVTLLRMAQVNLAGFFAQKQRRFSTP